MTTGCTCTRCLARITANQQKAETILAEVRRHVAAWEGLEIAGSEFRYFKLVMHVEFIPASVVFQCTDGGTLISLGESADRDIVAWIHNQIVNSLRASSVEAP